MATKSNACFLCKAAILVTSFLFLFLLISYSIESLRYCAASRLFAWYFLIDGLYIVEIRGKENDVISFCSD